MINLKRSKDEIDVVISSENILLGIEDDVNRGESLLWSQAPDMEFVNAADARNLKQGRDRL